MRDLKKTPIEGMETFTKYGDVFTKVYADDTKHLYIYERTPKDKTRKMPYPHYEVIKAYKEGGNYCYPSSAKWGTFGWTYTGSRAWDLAMARIDNCARNQG